jgi:hypothetical protein
MARLERFELPTARFVAEYSIQLSYRRIVFGRAIIVVCGYCVKYGAALRAFNSSRLLSNQRVRTKSSLSQYLYEWQKAIHINMAESEGFEPSIRFPVYTLSRGAPSATRPALLNSTCFPITTIVLAEAWRTCALLRASCPPPFGPSAQNADVLDCSRQSSQPLGQLS